MVHTPPSPALKKENMATLISNLQEFFSNTHMAMSTDDASALTAATAQTGGTPRTIYKVSLVIINANSRDHIITFAAPSSGSYFRYFDLKGIGAHIVGLARRSRIAATLS
ncbi:hypothetical protein BHE90_017379 [Fusarium euwallaceae]|uniref:Uncharacterized protein n=1 Tax=Fusarium euwallaceae TaxID=1147111 RepID=A0A430KXW9_9HYPO|nr:hypothetical protein BHE90_017379 [Fusarium euwallaceae]